MNNTRVGGEMTPCNAPLLVLERVESVGADGRKVLSYTARAVVRERLTFTDRPQPVIGGSGVR